MKISKRVISTALAAIMITTALSACSNNSGTSTGNTDSTQSNTSQGTTDSKTEGTDDNTSKGDTDNSGFVGVDGAPSDGTVMRWLGYYDLNTEDREMVDKFADEGYSVEFISTTYNDYFEKLAQLVASGDSPDLVRYEWVVFPHCISKNLFTPMDNYIDFDSELWSGMKDTIDNFNYKGKHYYIPYQMTSGVVLLYNSSALENAGINDDPLDLYYEGEWTWNAWKEIMQEWCNQGEDYYGYLPTGFVAMPFIQSTGTVFIDVDGKNKTITNNMKDANVQRCQDFLTDLALKGMAYPEYIDPREVFVDGKILFAEFGLDWGYSSAQGAMKDDIIKYVPIPRDEKADAYYMNSNTYGYLVPANAKNVKAGIKYMEICRANEIDPERIAKARAEALAEKLYYPKCPECGVSTPDKLLANCPECNAERRMNKNHVPMDEDLYDLSIELKNPESEIFTFNFDDSFGFTPDLTNMLQMGDQEGNGCVLGAPMKFGDSYTTLRDSYFGTVEAYIEPYRVLLADES